MKGAAILLLTMAALVAMPDFARAGYAHYFAWNGQPDSARLAACIADMAKIVAAAKILVAGPDGSGSPDVEPLEIEFNGVGANAQSPFDFPGNVGRNSCKTQLKPYDAVVTACLIAARDHFPPTMLAIASDGNWDEGEWNDGARLYRKALGRQPANPISPPVDFDEPEAPPDPPANGSPRDLDWVGRSILIALGLAAVWWFTQPHWEFKIFVEADRIDRVRGEAPRQFLMEVDDICRRFKIPRGTVRALRVRNWKRLFFSGSIPPECRQRIRNTWAAHLWRGRLRGL